MQSLASANKLFHAGDYEGALNEYRKIISQDQNKATIKIVECNIQLCYQFLGIPSYNNFNENLQTTPSDSQKKIRVSNACRCDLNDANFTFISGWAIDYKNPKYRLKILIYVDCEKVGEANANQYREDLMLAEVGDQSGTYAFTYQLNITDKSKDIKIEILKENGQQFEVGTFLKIIKRPDISTFLPKYTNSVHRIYTKNIYNDFKYLKVCLDNYYTQLKNVPQVDVIMPTFQRAHVISKAIDSCLLQTHSKWKLYVCDDGSDDGTEDMLENKYSHDPRIIYIRLNHQGVSEARNAGLYRSESDYIAFLDSDNTWDENYLKLMLSYMECHSLESAYCQISLQDDNNHLRDFRGDMFSWQSCLKQNYIDLNCFMHRGHLYMNKKDLNFPYFFDSNLPRLVDWDYILRVTKHIKTSHLPLVLVSYYDGSLHKRITNTEGQDNVKFMHFKNTIQDKHCQDVHFENLDALPFFKSHEKNLLEPSELNTNTINEYFGDKEINYFPDYTSANDYQKLFYQAFPSSYQIVPKSVEEIIDEFLTQFQIQSKQKKRYFHLHWHNAIFTKTDTKAIRQNKCKAFLSRLTFLKNIGFEIAWTIHNKVPHDSEYPELEIEFIQSILQIVDHVLVHHYDVLKIVSDAYEIPLDKVVLIEHASYPDLCRHKPSFDVRERFNLPSNSIVFGSIGQIRKYKGHQKLIEEFLRVSKIQPNIYLLIAGKPVNYDKELLISAAQDSKNIIFDFRFLPEDHIYTYMKTINCLILSYENILTSGSFYLAESAGCPVICPGEGLFKSESKINNSITMYDPDQNGDLAKAITLFSNLNSQKLEYFSKQMLIACMKRSWSKSATPFVLSLEIEDQFSLYESFYNKVYKRWLVNESFGFLDSKKQTLAIIVHYSNIDDTCECVHSLKLQTICPEILIVVNSEASKDSLFLNSKFPDVAIVQSFENSGYAAAVNFGLYVSRLLSFDYFWILNPDLDIPHHCGETMMKFLASSDNNLVGTTLVSFEQPSKVKFCGGFIKIENDTLSTGHMHDGSDINSLPTKPFQCTYLTGANIYGKVNCLNLLGYMPEHYFLYFEETHWFHGYNSITSDRPWVIPDLIIKNKKRSESHGLPTIYYFYYMIRNWLLFTSHVRNIPFDSCELPQVLKMFIHNWLKKINNKDENSWRLYKDIALVAIDHAKNGFYGRNFDINNSVKIWGDRFELENILNLRQPD